MGLEVYRQICKRFAIPVGTRSIGYLTKLLDPKMEQEADTSQNFSNQNSTTTTLKSPLRAPCFLFPEWCFSFPWGHFSRIVLFCPRGVFLFRSVFLVPRNLFFCPWNRFECYWNMFFGSPWYFRCPEGFFLCPTEMKCFRVFLVPVSFGNIDFVAWFNEKRFTKQRYGRCWIKEQL